jgi:hypothetical protein
MELDWPFSGRCRFAQVALLMMINGRYGHV